MKPKITALQIEARKARFEYFREHISKEDAVQRIQPYIDAVNEGAVRIAKEFRMKAKKVAISGYLRGNY